MADTQLYTYVHFNVKDFANNYSLSSYALESTPLTFIPDLTTATLLSAELFISNKILQWDFGDGTT